MHFFPNFSRSLWIGTLKRINKEKMCCPVGFFEVLFTVFQVTMSQIDTENDKKPKFSNFQSFYAFFVKVSTVFLV